MTEMSSKHVDHGTRVAAEDHHDSASQDRESSPRATDSLLSSINAQLISHGWTKRPLNLSILPDKEHQAVTTVLFDLLASSVSNLANFDELAARHRTLTYEHERLSRQGAQTRNAMGRLEAEVLGWKARSTEWEKRFLAEEAKNKELREEVVRGRKALEGVRVAATHEAKKNQLKLDKANSQLLKLSNDASLMARPQGLTLLNPISGGRSHPVHPPQPVLLEQGVKDLAEIRQSLQEETEAFRHVVVTTGNAIREALAARDGIEDTPKVMHAQFFSVPVNSALGRSLTHQSASSTAHPTIADAKLKALIAEVRKKLTEGVTKRVVDIAGQPVVSGESPEDIEERKRSEREIERIRVELEERVKDLEVEITCVKAREIEAQRLVEEMAKKQAQERVGRPDEEAPRFDEEEYQSLRSQQRKLDEERRTFAEANARLEHQRQRFEIERAAFEDERRQADAQAMMAYLPSSPSSAASSSSSTTSPTDPIAGPSSPRPRQHPHNPSSPSPLSPHKTLTPRPASVGRKKVKTPLSRLVLEKAVRQKGKENATASELARLESSVLGESGRRANIDKGKTRATPTGLKGSTLGLKTPSLGSSTLGRSTLKSETNLAASRAGQGKDSGNKQRPAVARGLSKAEGVGPRGVLHARTSR